MLYTKQQAADKINDIYALNKAENYNSGVKLPYMEQVLEKLNNRQPISLAYMITEPLSGGIKDFNVTPTGFGGDYTVEPIREITLKLKMLILVPIGDAWTDDITMRLLVLSGLNYDQSFFDQILNTRYMTYRANRTNIESISEAQLFEEFIKAQNDLI